MYRYMWENLIQVTTIPEPRFLHVYEVILKIR